MGVDCNDPNQTRPPFPALMTFYRDGTLTAYANPPGTGPLDTPEAGLWQREPGSTITPSTIYLTSMTKTAPLLDRG